MAMEYENVSFVAVWGICKYNLMTVVVVTPLLYQENETINKNQTNLFFDLWK